MADYAISNVPRRVVYAASGVGPYAFTFEILAASDIAVYKASTLLTLTTDYTVTINANGTGSVTLVATAGTSNITIVGSKTIARTTDFTTGGDFFANTLNDELDAQTIFIQQVAETAERGLKAPVVDPTDIAMTLPSKDNRKGKVLAFDSTTGNPVAGPALDAVVTVIEQSANINTVATNIASVNTVAGNISNVNTVAGVSSSVTTVASNIANVNAVGSDLLEATSEINTVAVDIANVNTVGNNIGNVNTVAGISANVTSVAGNSTNINTVAGNNANVTTVAGISSNVTTVAGVSANVTTVAGINAAVSTVATNNANVSTVATNIAAVNTNATNIVAIQNASTNATNAATSATAAQTAQSAAESARDATLAAYDNFDDRYLGSKTSNPSLDNDGNALVAGALYFNSVSGAMQVYTGSAWVAAYVSGTGFLAVANNLSDVASTSSARTNLGLGTGDSPTFTGLVTGAGTVSAPAITTTGDTNTGIFFPAADTIAFTEGGVESMRITSAGDVGIGTASPSGKFQVTTAALGEAIRWTDASNSTGILTTIAGASAIQSFAALSFYTNNPTTEKMRITTAGNVLIGNTTDPLGDNRLLVQSASSASSNRTFSVYNTAATSTTAFANRLVQISSSGNGADSTIHFSDQVANNAYFGMGGGALYFATGGTTERMRINSSGDVGIGATTITNNKLLVRGAHVSGGAVVGLQTDQAATGSPIYLGFFNSSNTRIGYVGCDTATNMQLVTAENVPMTFGTNNAERMRITSTGNVLIGSTTVGPVNANAITLEPTNSYMRVAHSGTGNGTAYIQFDYNGTSIGSVTQLTTASVAFNTSSDYRLKENIAPMTGALLKVAQLKPCTYTWKADGSNGQGFIAHELQEVVPDCVTGEKDGEQMQGVDTSFLVATLTAAIQEQQALIENLTTRLNALEGK